jgi:hypothetical protein
MLRKGMRVPVFLDYKGEEPDGMGFLIERIQILEALTPLDLELWWVGVGKYGHRRRRWVRPSKHPFGIIKGGKE